MGLSLIKSTYLSTQLGIYSIVIHTYSVYRLYTRTYHCAIGYIPGTIYYPFMYVSVCLTVALSRRSWAYECNLPEII